jgi:leader peptidase (prepilin peptidase)/N-methyltransferase
MEQVASVCLLSIVTLLSCIQVPLDLRERHLSRGATLLGLAAVGLVCIIDASVNDSAGRFAVAIILSSVTSGLYWFLHWRSPSSMGLGDVLLVLPLSMAVAYVAAGQLLLWQLAAAMSGGIHATYVRLTNGDRSIPYGPHLLIAAWLTIAWKM